MDVLARRVVELGVDVRYDHRAVALVTDDAHRVHGLILRAGGEHAVRPCAQGCRALHRRLRHEPRDGPASRALDAALELPDRHRRRRLRHPPRRERRRRRDQHGRGIRHAALVSARLAGQGHLRQRARPALRQRGLLSRARVAVHPAAARRSHLAAGRCRVVSADGVPGTVARRDRRGWRDLGGSGARARACPSARSSRPSSSTTATPRVARIRSFTRQDAGWRRSRSRRSSRSTAASITASIRASPWAVSTPCRPAKC